MSTYAGPPRWELPSLIAKHLAEHRRQMMFARACRMTGNGGGHGRAMERATLARRQVRYLKACAA